MLFHMRYTKRTHLASLFEGEKNEYLMIQEKSLLHSITIYIGSIEINILARIKVVRYTTQK